MPPVPFNTLTGTVRPLRWMVGKYASPLVGAIYQIQMNRLSDTASILSILRALIGGNGLSIVISSGAGDFNQLKLNIRFQIVLLVLFAEILGIPALASLYRESIRDHPDTKIFFRTIVGARYIECEKFYDDAANEKYEDLPDDPVSFIESIIKFIMDLILNVIGVVVIIGFSGMLTSIMNKSILSGNAHDIKTPVSSYNNRVLTSPEVVLGYANWNQILNDSLYASMIGETYMRMYANFKLSPEAWLTLNPLMIIYWTYLRLNILFTMRFNSWINAGISSKNYSIPQYIHPKFSTNDYNEHGITGSAVPPTTTTLNQYYKNNMLPTSPEHNPGGYPDILTIDIITRHLEKTNQIPTIDQPTINNANKIPGHIANGIGFHSPHPDGSENYPTQPQTIEYQNPADTPTTSATTLPCVNFVTGSNTGQFGNSGCIQAFCKHPSCDLPDEALMFLGMSQEDIDIRNENKRTTKPINPTLDQKRKLSGLYVFDDIIAEDTQVAEGHTLISDVWSRIVEVYVTQQSVDEAIEDPTSKPTDIAVFSLATNHSIDFKITHSNDTDADTAIVTLYNINPKTKAKFESDNTRILVKAGYDGDFGTIFEGFVTDFYDTRIGADTATTIIAYNDMYKIQKAVAMPIKIETGKTAELIISELMALCGIPVGYIDLPEKHAHEGDTRMLPGNPYLNLLIMAQICTQYVHKELTAADWYTHPDSYTFYVKDNIGYFVPRNYISPSVVKIGTGKGKHGALLSANKAEDSSGLVKAEIKTILNHRLKTDVQVDIDSITLGKQNYKVVEITHTCSQKQFVSTAKLGVY